MVIEVKPEHLQNVVFPILVTLSGMVMEVRLVHPENALISILVTPLGIILFMHPVSKVFVAVSIKQFWEL